MTHTKKRITKKIKADTKAKKVATKLGERNIVKTKKQKVADYLLAKKKITSWDSIKMFGATRLAAIIFNLRADGWIIDTQDIEFKDRYKNKGTYALYTLISTPRKK